MTDPSAAQAGSHAPPHTAAPAPAPAVHITRHALRRGLAIVLLSLPLAYALSRSNSGDLYQIDHNPAAYLANQRETASWSFVEHFYVLAIIIGLVVILVDGATSLLARVIPDSGSARRASTRDIGAIRVTSGGGARDIAFTAARHSPRPVVAGLLSLVVPGLGQLYADDERRAVLAWLTTFAVSFVLFIVFVREPGVATDAFVVAAALLVMAMNVLDGARTALRASASTHWDSRWPAIAVIGLLFMLGVQPACRAVARLVGDAYRLPSNSMAPGLLAGDWVTAVPAGPEAVKRGARLAFHAWDGDILIKRVVALPGDTIAMRNDTLTIDGRPQQEPYVYAGPETIYRDQTDASFEWQRGRLATLPSAGEYHPTSRTWGPVIVPRDSAFVLGDNRYNSLDSRYRGFVARNAFFARPTGVYFSRDPDDKKIRWERIGMRIE
jgi:signal peptidase I